MQQKSVKLYPDLKTISKDLYSVSSLVFAQIFILFIYFLSFCFIFYDFSLSICLIIYFIKKL